MINSLQILCSLKIMLPLKLSNSHSPYVYEKGEPTISYKPITLLCFLFMFIEMKFIHCHSCVMFAMKSMSMCND